MISWKNTFSIEELQKTAATMKAMWADTVDVAKVSPFVMRWILREIPTATAGESLFGFVGPGDLTGIRFEVDESFSQYEVEFKYRSGRIEKLNLSRGGIQKEVG